MKRIICLILIFLFIPIFISCNAEKNIDISEGVGILKSAFEKTIHLEDATIKIHSSVERERSYIIYESGCSYNKAKGSFSYYNNFNKNGELTTNSVICFQVDYKYQIYLESHEQNETYKIMQEVPEQYYVEILDDIDINGFIYYSDYSYEYLFDDLLYGKNSEYGDYKINSVVKRGKEYTYEIEYERFGTQNSANDFYTLKIKDGIIVYIKNQDSSQTDIIEIEPESNIEKNINKSDYKSGIVTQYTYFGYGW